MAEYLSYAEALAWSIRQRLPASTDMDEILSLARLGLLEAARKYDPARRVTFKTFAYYRIRGAILDGIRSMTLHSRREHEKIKFQRAMDLYLQQETAAPPAAAPVHETRFGVSELRQMLFVMSSVYLMSLDTFAENGFSPAQTRETPHDELERSEACLRLKKIVAKLPEDEQTVIRLYYYENKTLDEIGGVLGLSKSWICRIHARILKKLEKLFTGSAMTGRNAIRA